MSPLPRAAQGIYPGGGSGDLIELRGRREGILVSGGGNYLLLLEG